ncbi:MAG: hypothetical protein FJW96_06260, partial [Actinobacteria bacterium]|nr:hypothetical protein [Actinomycetota bacterium]
MDAHETETKNRLSIAKATLVGALAIAGVAGGLVGAVTAVAVDGGTTTVVERAAVPTPAAGARQARPGT